MKSNLAIILTIILTFLVPFATTFLLDIEIVNLSVIRTIIIYLLILAEFLTGVLIFKNLITK